MKIEIVNPLEYPNWDDLLLTNPETTFFHTSAWARVLSESYKYRPFYFAVIEDGRLWALIPIMEIESVLTGKRGISLPFTDECRPISQKCEQLKDLQQRICEYGRRAGWTHIELRGAHEGLAGNSVFAHYCLHTIELDSDPGRVFSKFRSNVKRNIKRALKEKIRVELATDWRSMKIFFLLNCIGRKHHGLPPQPLIFFKKIYEQIVARQKGLVALTFRQDMPIAGAIFFHFGPKSIFKYGASNRKYLHLRPNNLVMWKAIKWLCGNGCKWLNLGRTDPQNKGLLQFKRAWGAREETLSYYRYDLKKSSFVTAGSKLRSSYNLFRLLPTSLARLSGNLLYRHFG